MGRVSRRREASRIGARRPDGVGPAPPPVGARRILRAPAAISYRRDMTVIEVANLQKRYGGQVAVDDVSFTVEAGEIFGVVGPNGSGKTTTVECVEGLRRPDGGTVRVLGLDPRATATGSRQVGVQLQAAQLPDRMRVWEALELYSSFYRIRPTGGRCWTIWGSPTGGTPASASSPAARSSACRWRWHWSATRGSRSSTS